MAKKVAAKKRSIVSSSRGAAKRVVKKDIPVIPGMEITLSVINGKVNHVSMSSMDNIHADRPESVTKQYADMSASEKSFIDDVASDLRNFADKF